MKFLPALFPLVVPCRVLAFPLSYKSTVAAKTRPYIPLIVIFISLFLFLVAIKLVYMKHRRIGTIHAPPTVCSIPTTSNLSSSMSSFELRDKERNRYRGFLVGCLGSPSWETNLTSRLDRATWGREQRSSIVHCSTIRSTRSASARTKSKNSSSSSRFTRSTALTNCSVDVDQFILPLSSGHSRIPTVHSGRSSRSPGSVQRNTSTHCHPGHCNDFGESHGAGGSVPKSTRRASPSSIRLVDGPSDSDQVLYSFLSGLPPDAIVVSPLMGTRDSFQLSTGKCSLKCNRKAVPPLPPLPSFLPFHVPKDSEALELYSPKGSGYLPPLRFSPLVSVAKVFHSQQQALERSSQTPDSDDNVACAGSRLTSSKAQHANNMGSLTSSSDTPPLHLIRKTNHKKSQSYKGLVIEGSSPRTTLDTDEVAALPLEYGRCGAKESMQRGVLCTPSGTSRHGSVGSRKPLKSCLRQHTPLVCSPESTLTPSISENSTQTWALATGRSMTGDHASLLTPISDVDIGILGLDRFHWNDDIKELKVQSCHLKKDSIALVPY